MPAEMMIHTAEWYTKNPMLDGGAYTYFDPTNYTDNGPLACCVQPATAKELQFYEARGTEVSHTVFLIENPGIKRNDVLIFKGRELVVVDEPIDFIEMGLVFQLGALEYPDAAQKR